MRRGREGQPMPDLMQFTFYTANVIIFARHKSFKDTVPLMSSQHILIKSKLRVFTF